MNAHSALTRRTLLKGSLAAAVAIPLTRLAGNAAEKTSAAASSTSSSKLPLNLGIASISLKKFTLDAVIAALKRLDLNYVSLYRTHAPWGGDIESCRQAGEKLRSAGIHLMATGVVVLPNNEAVVKQAFETAKAAQLPTITCKPEPDAFPLIERFVKEYDIRLAIHNHGPEDKLYPSPHEAWTAASKYDKRIGLCIDVGHTLRAGVNPSDVIRRYAERLYDVHVKDTVAQTGEADTPVEFGRGRVDGRDVLQALIEARYRGQVGLEYEVDGEGKEDPLPGVAESIGYLRGLLRT
jgi:inosose dehydratase